MEKFIIDDIFADGYERFAIVEGIEHNIKLNVHFLEYDEYLENSEESRKKKKGDILEGCISIGLVTVSERVDKELIYHQEIPKSSHIEAIVEVVQIINKYSMYAFSSILDENILIKFENVVEYKVGDRILIIGSLEMNEIVICLQKKFGKNSF